MRILFVITPGVGHAFPLVPLAWAFRGAGHDVLVATGRTRPTWSSSGQTIAVTNAGLPVVDISPEFDQPGFWQPIIAQLARDNPELAEQIAGMRGGKINDLRLAAAFLSKMSGFLADGALEVAHECRAPGWSWRPSSAFRWWNTVSASPAAPGCTSCTASTWRTCSTGTACSNCPNTA